MSKQHPPSSPKSDGGDNKPSKCHVFIEPGVQVDIVNSLKEQHKTERDEDSANHKKQIFWAKIGALLILVYAGLTAWQACSAHSQQLTNSKQLQDFEEVQAARLTFEDPEITIITGPRFVADISIVMRNDGITVADDISVNVSWGGYSNDSNQTPEPSKGTGKPIPSDAGPSLGPGKIRTYKVRVGESFATSIGEINIPGLGKFNPADAGTSERILSGKESFLITATVSYRDIFHKSHITTDCWRYDPQSKTWPSCPNLRQHQ